MKLHCIKRAYEGVSLSDLRRDVSKPAWSNPAERAENAGCTCGEPGVSMCSVHGYEWKRMIGMLRCDPRFIGRNPTHSWKLHESGDYLKIYAVKKLR